MASPTDTLRAKTDDELRFYVENPSYYQAELVAAAQRELRRRGLGPAAPAPTPVPAPPDVAGYDAYAEVPPRRSPLPWLAGAVVVGIAAVSFWSWPRHSPPPAPAAPPAAPPQLVEAPSYPMPFFSAEQNVDREMALIPAAEQTNDQKLHQFRELSKRFWLAQNPSAYLIKQSGHVLSYPLYGGQLKLAQDHWHYLNKGLVYRFDLPPTMADHLLRMRVISRIQYTTIGRLQRDCDAQRNLQLTPTMQLAQDTVQHLLPALQHRMGVLKAQ